MVECEIESQTNVYLRLGTWRQVPFLIFHWPLGLGLRYSICFESTLRQAKGTAMSFQGKVWKFGNDINTDEIFPARYLNIVETEHLAAHVMEDADPEFPKKISKGDIIVAGKNFGCGSSREHAPAAIKAAGIACVIAGSFARIFFRNAFNTGLLIFEAPDVVDAVNQGDIIEIDAQDGTIKILSSGKTYKTAPIPPFMKELLDDGGLISHLKKISRQNEVQ